MSVMVFRIAAERHRSCISLSLRPAITTWYTVSSKKLTLMPQVQSLERWQFAAIPLTRAAKALVDSSGSWWASCRDTVWTAA